MAFQGLEHAKVSDSSAFSFRIPIFLSIIGQRVRKGTENNVNEKEKRLLPSFNRSVHDSLYLKFSLFVAPPPPTSSVWRTVRRKYRSAIFYALLFHSTKFAHQQSFFCFRSLCGRERSITENFP